MDEHTTPRRERRHLLRESSTQPIIIETPMEVMHIQFKVKPDAVESFAEATRANAEAMRAEPGNVRCEVVQSLTDETVFVMLEAYEDAAAKEAHFGSKHFAAWQSAIGDLVEDSTVSGCRPIFPAEGDW